MKFFFLLIILTPALHTIAQDRFFARTYTSNVLPKGAIDLEFSHTSRFGREQQYFNAQDQRMEVEIGVGRSIQTAFYFNRFQQRFSEGTSGTSTSNEIGFSNEWKIKLSDPTANKIGLALYAEASVKGGDEVELESKIILDKYIGKSLFAFNGVAEFEKEFDWENSAITNSGWATPVEFDFGYMYDIKPVLGAGFEIVNKNDISRGQGWKNSIMYAGPTINYRGNRWFVIINYLSQLKNIRKTVSSPGSKVLDEHERTEISILFGITL